MRLGYALALLALVGFVASLEASPVPLTLEPARIDVTGYSLVVVPSSAPGAEEITKQALRSGVSVVVVLTGLDDWVSRLIDDVKPVRLRGEVEVLLAVEENGTLSLATDRISPRYGLGLESFAPLVHARGLGVVYTEEPSGNVTLVYIEVPRNGAILAVGDEEAVRAAKAVERLSGGGRVLEVPRTGFAAAVGVFHAATLLWLLASMLDTLRAAFETPTARVALVLLGLGVSLLGLLPALALLTEQEPARAAGRARRLWTRLARLLSLKGLRRRYRRSS